jgi:hypothetical protein
LNPSSAQDLTSLEARQRLVEALELDLVGPWPGHEFATEVIGWRRPSNWYLTGFLVPRGAGGSQIADDDVDDEIADVGETSGLAEESSDERSAAKKGFFPSSMGISVLVSADTTALDVTVAWGDYELVPRLEEPNEASATEEADDGAKPNPDVWTRTPREVSIEVPLGGTIGTPVGVPLPGFEQVELQVLERRLDAEVVSGQLPEGVRSISLFLVNGRKPAADDVRDRAFLFQPRMEVRSDAPFVGRPDLRGGGALDWDGRLADLHYAEAPEYGTGHGVSVDWEITAGECRVLRTAWVPRADVEKTETVEIDGVETRMETLGTLADGEAAKVALTPLVERYRAWIDEQRGALDGLTATRAETAEELLRQAERAATRIEHGIDLLVTDPQAFDAFRMANRAVGRALSRRNEIAEPAWRTFQLAFLLLNLPGIADSADSHRETVDLLFFPTGGGKTEAYLGLAAAAMVLRRLRCPADDGRAGGGVSAVMRYTLRLLTLDQLSRASGLVCALELEREQHPELYGEWPFEIGLWVGKAATPNLLGRKGDGRSDTARAKVRQFKNDPLGKPSPIPLEECPWCGERFTADSFNLLPNDDDPEELKIVCSNFECEFSGGRALPVLGVDEPIYRRLPAFLIATVDKFASLPWVGESGLLLGGAERYDAGGYLGPGRTGGAKLESSLAPPDLVIQDELHLISGPLGTMAGLYEAAIEGLCVARTGERRVRPKIVASTATVRQAQDQIQALFGRSTTRIFPPPGLDRRDSFFARTVLASQAPARRYLGVAAQGRNAKVVMRRVWLALMGAAERAYRDAGGHTNHENPADPYMTIVGYFNSLRELGGARRILEEEVRNTVQGYGARRRIGESPGLFQDRRTFSEVVELTSRVPTDKIAEARARLALPFQERDRVDCAIATNMISVGLDIPRLGLMGVIGQPKTAAEYIQATSRVGRRDDAPGLVVTVFNVHKPRDRSHYERFRHFHETFYRSVEVSSVTPFSARALDRGFPGSLVALARHLDPALTPSLGPRAMSAERVELERSLLAVFRDRVDAQPIAAEAERDERQRSVRDRVVDLLDSWINVVEDHEHDGVAVKYQKYELPKSAKPLLLEILDDEITDAHHRKFRLNRSLREVEPQVNLVIKGSDPE